MTDNNNSQAIAAGMPYPRPGIAWYSVILLALLYWLSILDRTIISLLVDPIKADIGISDVQFGMLHGLAFAVTFSLFGLIAGSLADRFNRRLIVFLSVTVWSLATAACGLAQNFWHLLLARVGVGAGEAGLNPCATSMITDLFPKEKLTSAMAVYSLGASVGSGCAFIFGGMLVEYVSAAETVAIPVLGEVKPWQAAFIIIGIPGVIAALCSFSMPEPIRRGRAAATPAAGGIAGLAATYKSLFVFIRSRGRFFFHHYLGFGMGSLALVGGAAWYPAHMGRSFGWSGGDIGLSLGVSLIAGGFAGKLLTGIMVDRMFSSGRTDAQFTWYAGCLLLSVPVAVFTMTTGLPMGFLVGLAFLVMLLSPMTALYMASLNVVTPNELRGAGVAFYSATIGLAALSLGPVLVALFSDHLYGGNAIGLGLATVYCIASPLGALVLYTGRAAMREAVAQAAA